MTYRELDMQEREAVEAYTLAGNHAGQCLDAVLALAPDKEAAMRAIVDAYGKYYHERENAREALLSAGVPFSEIFRLSVEYQREAKP